MKRFAILFFVLGLATPLLVYAPRRNAINAQTQELQQDDVVRVNTTLVTLPVSVKNRKGKTILNLRREDFHLYENGVEQEIAYFEPPDEVNNQSQGAGTDYTEKLLTVALLIDISDSTQFKIKQIQEAALAFVDQLRPQDRMLVMSFDKNARVLTEPTNDRNTLREAISRTRTGGGTGLYDAVGSALNWLNRISGRKAIVLLTDGVDTASDTATYDSTVRAAAQLDAAIYPIQYSTYGDFADNPSRQTNSVGDLAVTAHVTKHGELASEAYKRATLYLRLLAEKTGGRFEYTDSVKQLSKSFAHIASELRQEYALGYYPKNRTMTGMARELKVAVDVPQVVIRARKSYQYKPLNR